MQLDDLYYDLPDELIAQAPTAERDASRLLVLDRAAPIARNPGLLRRLTDLPEYLQPADVLVINDTRVVPARFAARRKTGGRVEGLYLEPDASGAFLCLLKPSARLREGEGLALGKTDSRLILEASMGGGRWRARLEPDQPMVELLDRIGQTPLPPYIKRPEDAPDAGDLERSDRHRYQTVYARAAGAVAAPTAGLHLSERLLAAVRQRGVEIVSLTLHVGLGTFEPIKAGRLQDHAMHAERYELPPASAGAINAARLRGGRTVVVGTTSARVLETCADPSGRVRPGRGVTDIFIYPPYTFRAVDVLLTNFHLPCSTLLAMVFALAGRERVLAAYAQAIDARMRFYSYGDAMLIV